MGIRPFDLIVVTVLWLIANLIFRNFERHVPIYRRLMKLVVILAVLSVAGFLRRQSVLLGSVRGAVAWHVGAPLLVVS